MDQDVPKAREVGEPDPEVFRDKPLVTENCKTLPVGLGPPGAGGRDKVVRDIDRCLDADEECVQHHIPFVPVGPQLGEGDGSVALPVPGCPIQFPEVIEDSFIMDHCQALVSRTRSNQSSVSA